MSVSRKDKYSFLSPLQPIFSKNRSLLKNYKNQQVRETNVTDPQTLDNPRKVSIKNMDMAIKSVIREGIVPMPTPSKSIDRSPDALQKTQDANFYKYKNSFNMRNKHTKKTSIDSEYSLKIEANGILNYQAFDTNSKFMKKIEPSAAHLPKEAKFYHSINKSNRNLSTQISYFHNNSKTNNKLSVIEDQVITGKFFPSKLDIKNFKLKDWKGSKPKTEEVSRNCTVSNVKPEETDQLRPNNSRKQLNASSFNKRNMTFSVSKDPIKDSAPPSETIPVILLEEEPATIYCPKVH